jgi:hypothetical protein
VAVIWLGKSTALSAARILPNPTLHNTKQPDHDEDRTPPPYAGNKNIVVTAPLLIGSNDIIIIIIIFFFFFVVVVQLFLRRCRL